MPDASEPDYRAILEQLQDYQSSLIGSSYYYIRAGKGYLSLCRIVLGVARYSSTKWWIMRNLAYQKMILKKQYSRTPAH
ncbi:MAG: hypothetical protein Q8R70_00825 [Methanoregula sp.]|nr:hypothetical protein [Methanoregula sp.]